MVETPNGTETVRFSDEPMCSKQIVQQHASDQPVTINEPESQAEMK